MWTNTADVSTCLNGCLVTDSQTGTLYPRRGDRKEKGDKTYLPSSLPSFTSHWSKLTPWGLKCPHLQVELFGISYFSPVCENGREGPNIPGTACLPTFLCRKQIGHDRWQTRSGISMGAEKNSLSTRQCFGDCFLSLVQRIHIILPLHSNDGNNFTVLPQGNVDSTTLHYNIFPF